MLMDQAMILVTWAKYSSMDMQSYLINLTETAMGLTMTQMA